MASHLSTSRPVEVSAAGQDQVQQSRDRARTQSSGSGIPSKDVSSPSDSSKDSKYISDQFSSLHLASLPHRTPSPGTAARDKDGNRANETGSGGAVDVPTLLSTLSAHDGESILTICVEDSEEEEGDGQHYSNGHGTRSHASRKTRKSPRVYGGSQGGSIHVSSASEPGLSRFITLQAKIAR